MRLLRLWPDESHFDFMRFRRFTFPLSALLSLATVVLFLTVGLNFGIDFKGGTLVELQAKSGTADVAGIRHTAAGFGFGEPEVQELGNQGTVLVRLPLQPGEQGQTAVMNKAHAAFDQDYDFRRTETVGPRVSGELVQSGTLGVVLSVVAVLLYLWFRFERELALGAIVGTLHDIVLTVGVFIITRIEFNMTSIAAILTIVGYSLNETVVVFDRTRELMRRYKTIPTVDLLNLSINSTMSRTVMTSISSGLSLLALVLFGGEAIKGFATVMLCGVLICTYSAIFISTPVLIYLGLMLSGARAASERSGVPQPAE
ncbi:protein translocase subunit SecF [Methylobacterium sp. J-088]|uniref:protein translocase subunit SecF n=1 Tax=unclassified Methylobacterium TaxID=2615210 RepID=UPI001FBAD0A1|nr:MULTISPECIES: protein translocase subunit SecF [unclassified Methylobacterium]MCJ2067128.1 protein translocase subunit SecF [Methylobacterium sp. J-088]